MAKAATKAVMVGGAAGTVLIAAAQTKPEEAVSNLAGWLHLLGIDQVPPFLDTLAADRWVTWAGIALILIPLALWLRHKWRDRPGTLEGWLSHGERPGAPPPRETVRRVRGYDLTDGGLDGLERVAKAFDSRKRKRSFTEFVLGIHPEVEQLRAAQSAGKDRSVQAGVIDEDRHYREALAKLEAPARARAAMLARKIGGRIGDPVALGEHLLEQDAREAEKEARKEKRRALIEKGRNVVHRFRQSGEQGFEAYASRDRDYLDIQPHLGDEYQAERSRAADRIGYGPDHDDYRTAMLLGELARLEREWDL